MRGPPPFATLYNGPQAARRWRGLPGARGAARARPRVALVCAALGPPRRNTRRGVPKPSKVCEKNAARRGSACRPAPRGGGRASRCPPWRLFRPRAYPPPSPPASVAGGGRGRFWLPSPGGGARSRGSRGREGFARSRPSRALWRLCPLVFFSRPLLPRAGPGLSPLRSPLVVVVPALCMAARRGRAAPPLRAARYTEGAEDGGNERRPERPRREALPPARGLVPCAPSFAIEPLRPYRISGSTANTPAPGNDRKGTAAQREL